MQVLEHQCKYWLGLTGILTNINQSLLVALYKKVMLTILYRYLTGS